VVDWWLASSAPYCETGDDVAVAETGLEGLLDVAVSSTRFPKSFRVSYDAWPPKIACGVRNGSELARLGFEVSAKNRTQVYAFAFLSGMLSGLAKVVNWNRIFAPYSRLSISNSSSPPAPSRTAKHCNRPSWRQGRKRAFLAMSSSLLCRNGTGPKRYLIVSGPRHR
jgi:hypothetical protein